MTMPHGPRTTHRTAPVCQDHHGRHGGHGWMMIACCVPMLVIAIVLVATDIISIGWLFAAIACTAMLALMMGGHRRTYRRYSPRRRAQVPRTTTT